MQICLLLPANPAAGLLAALPASSEHYTIVPIEIGKPIEEIDASAVTALVWVPPTPPTRLIAAFDHLMVNGRLQWVHALSAGVDSLADFISSRLANSPTVQLTNGRGAFSSSLAEYVMAACLQHNKQMRRCESNRRNGTWDKFVMGTLKGRTMGFVGFGDIAKHTAKLAAPFGMKLIALRRHPQKAEGEKLHSGESTPLTFGPDQATTFYQQCDFVVCSLPLTAETRKCIGREAFSAMKDTALLVSLGRGAVIDEEALYEALQGGQIAGAACDVFAIECAEPVHELASSAEFRSLL